MPSAYLQAEHTAEILVDPVRCHRLSQMATTHTRQYFQSRVIRDHINYSNAIRDNLPGALKQLDDTIHAFSSELGVRTLFNSKN